MNTLFKDVWNAFTQKVANPESKENNENKIENNENKVSNPESKGSKGNNENKIESKENNENKIENKENNENKEENNKTENKENNENKTENNENNENKEENNVNKEENNENKESDEESDGEEAINISIETTHVCDEEECGHIYVEYEKNETDDIPSWRMKRVVNPEWKDGKCEKSGKAEENSIHIESWHGEEDRIMNLDEVVIADTNIQIEYDYPLSDVVRFAYESPSGFTRGKLVDLIYETYHKIYEEEEETTPEITYNYKPHCSNCKKTYDVTDIIYNKENNENKERKENKENKENEENNENQCSICYLDYVDGDVITVLPCHETHKFHKSCIMGWFQSNQTCPMDRGTVKSGMACDKCPDGTISYTTKVIPIEHRGGFLNRRATEGKYGIWGHDLSDLFIEGISYYPDSKVVRMFIGS